MKPLFNNRYKTDSQRLAGWDYGSNAAYFVTICTRHRLYYFGDIHEERMHVNDLGSLANRVWLQIPDKFPYARLGEFIIMPNHVHGIIIIDKPDVAEAQLEDVQGPVETRLIASLPSLQLSSPQPKISPGGVTGKHNPMLQDNLSRIVRWYKGRTTFEVRKINPDFGWQTLFHDHIIRNDSSYRRIANYIINNPATWAEDSLR